MSHPTFPISHILIWIFEDLFWDRLDHGHGGNERRLRQLYRWHERGGVMVTTHDTFLKMVSRAPAKPSSAAAAADMSSRERRAEERRAEYTELFRKLLQDPGADILVVDEGHRMKNDRSRLALELSQVSTRRRVLMTGTPLQNNLVEYFHMVNYVKPGELGTLTSFKTLFEGTIAQGQHRISEEGGDAAEAQRTLAVDLKTKMNKRIWTLTNKLELLVQRRSTEILHRELKRKTEYKITVRLVDLQRTLYNAKVGESIT